MPFGSPGPYPLPDEGGPHYNKFQQFAPDWDEVTDETEFEDGGASYLLRNDEAPIRWTITYQELEEVEAEILDEHRNDAAGHAFGFELTNPRTGVTYENVHYDKDYTEDHVKTWVNQRTVKLICRPPIVSSSGS